MFGSSNIQSSWANPQQNQQQQQQQQQPGGSVFGQPSTGAFGSTSGAFGGGGAFGQPQQPQQTNSVFGAGTNTGGAFGAFGGANNNNQAQTGGLFGAAKPATTTGFGAFGGGGGTNAFGAGGGGAFGTPANTANTTNAFGSTSTGAFGNGGGVFGAKPAGVFGTTNTAANPNAGQYDGVPPVTTGSSNPPYSVFTDKDAANPSVTLQYQSITCMPQYRGTSFEELRWQDYQQGRKTASTGGFGTTAFGQTQPAPTGGVFGAPAQPAQNTGSTFGAFGGGTTGGAFGQQNNAGGAFGGGAFGQQNQQQQQQPAATGFGAFGQNNQQQQQPATGTGLFGSSNTSAFGANNNQPKPFGAFGGTGTGAFGSTATNTGGGLFGQNNQQQQQQPAATGGLFGQTNNQQTTGGAFGGGTGAFGAKPASGLFGSTTGTTGFGAFGANNNQQQNQQQPAQTGGLFGAAANNNNNATGGGLFGQNNQTQNQPAAGGGLFGAQNNNQQQPAAGGGLFGQNNNTAGGGLFGQNNQNQQQAGQTGGAFGGGGLFGAKPAAPAGGGLFGSTTNNTGGGLFGQNNANANAGTQSAGGGLFGASTLGQNPAQPAQGAFGSLGGGSGLFGAKPAVPAQPAGGLGTSAFGQSTFTTSQLGGAPAAGAQQPSLQPSISQPVATNLPIFSMLSSTSGATGVNLDQSTKKKSSLFEAPVSQPRPHVLGFQPAQSQKLRGYASSMRASTPNGSGLNFSLTAGKANVLNFSVSGSRIGPDAFTTSAVQGSGASKSSVKKLILDKKVDPTELLRRSSSSPVPGRASFNPALSIQHREREASAAPQSPAPAPKRGTRFVGPASSEIVDEPAAGNRPLQEGDYWCRPPLQELQVLDFDALSAVNGLVIGRVGYGQIEFLDPVDLTTLSKLGDLFGSQVAFETMECSVYPDVEDVDKPPPGAGLNVPARITLLRCYVLDKATRQPIKDENNERAKKHVARLRSMPGTTFESFSIEEGKWTFTVQHF